MKSFLYNIILPALLLSSAGFVVCSAPDVSSCLGSDLFVFAPGQSGIFAQAETDCELRQGALARIQSLEEFNLVINLIDGARVWIGIDARAKIGNRSPGTIDFAFTDGTVGGESFFRVDIGAFPWRANQPDNFQDNEPCAQIESGLLNDRPCDDVIPFVCRVVDSPTCIPPTTSPTSTPSSSPSTKPTNSPTFNPTASPSTKPTNSPTFNPTASPSSKPTISPSFKPTSSPTSNPSILPSFNPTTSPSAKPTKSPTSKPTFTPTSSPLSPTLTPSSAPTNSPVTFVPSSSPTTNPTSAPSDTPPRQCVTEKIAINRPFEF